jgi:pimeloyl-ACP methyl ester carboxylesterase
VFKRNVEGLSANFHVIILDLRGHGQSEKPRAGYHVARLALDLKNLIEHLRLPEGQVSAIGTSLGAAILWYERCTQLAAYTD